ncbi:universal stress protein [Brevibacterium daeguense]|uniref:Universal stress protein n=1 Tax=Brevibacterium daeguense TaxID=909936 RepID=A0ABP8EKK3_9MICO|nr:universal stress protein [Brevibacterium daeguense]
MSIVVGYIPTPEGEAALERGLAEARKTGVTVVVVNGSREQGRSDRRRLTGEALAELRRRLDESGVDHRVVQPANENEPAEQLLDAAQEHDAELIVIGLRRRTPVGKFLLGSAAQRVLIEASCPVLAVKSDPGREG